MNNNKGQVTLFIIIAIMLVIGIVGLFFLMGGADIDVPTGVNPREDVDKCVRNAVEDSVEKMLANGGQIAPSQAIGYDGEEYNYLCYQGDYYSGCYNLHPMLEFMIENETRVDTQDAISTCFDVMREDYEAQGFTVGGNATSYSVNLLPGKVEISLKKDIVVTKESTQSFSDFDTEVLSPIYELVGIAREIVNSESQFCNFEYNGYMLLYPKYEIRRIDYSDSKIYKVIDRRTGAEFKFAVRSCAFAPGI